MSTVKNIIASSLISAVFAVGVSYADSLNSTVKPVSHAKVAQSAPADQNVIITDLELKSSDPAVVSNADCDAYSNKPMEVSSASGDHKIGNKIIFKNVKMGHTYTSHNLSRRVWTANLYYVAKDGKVSQSKVYGEELMIKGMNVAYGSFINGYCEGFYKKTY